MNKGARRHFIVRTDTVSASPINFNLSFSGTANNPNDVVLPSAPFTCPPTCPRRPSRSSPANGLVEPDKTLTVTVASGTGYTLGIPALGDDDHRVE